MLMLALALAAAPMQDALPLPEGNAYVRALVDRHRLREDAVDSYAYDLTEQREELDGKGRATRRESRRYQVFHVRGRAVRTLVEENGAPLPRGRAEREAGEARAQAQAIGAGRVAVERPALRLSEVLARCDFRTVAREDVGGRPALVLEFQPRPDAPADGGLGGQPRSGVSPQGPRAGIHSRSEPPKAGDRFLRRLAGRVWIDEAEGQVVRAQIRNTAPFRVAGGLGASVSAFEMSLEYRKVDGAVWLPLHRQTTVSGRKLLLKTFRVRSTSTYGEFRRFSVEADEKVHADR